MSGLQTRGEDQIAGVDVREQGSALRVATNTPHLVSLGTGRLSTAVTLHPINIKQGRVTIGSDPTCDIYVVGTGVASVHCRVENSHGVVTLYPISGSTLLDGVPVDKATRLSQGSMLTIGRSNYLRFNHPEEATLMKSVLPSGHVSMAPVQYQPNECSPPGNLNHQQEPNNCYQKIYRDNSLSELDHELDVTLKEMSRKKPPVAPRKPYRDLDLSDSNSDQESKPKLSSIMAKVSKFEYYAKLQRNVGRSQFYTNGNDISPKVFSSNSLTVNTPAKDVIGKHVPNFMKKDRTVITENNSVDPRSGSYTNVAIRKTKIEDIVRNFDDNPKHDYKLPKKINNDQVTDNVYGKINVDRNNVDAFEPDYVDHKNELYARIDKNVNPVKASSNFDRNPQYSPVYANFVYDRGLDAENRRIKAYQDRIKEEEQKEAETARLEEILNMCAEYEKQITSGTPITPTEKRSHNKIITNGSLPRSAPINSPNLVQTSEGYYKFETSHSNNSMSQSLPAQRHLSSYENFELPTSPHLTSDVSNQSYDKIGIPVFEEQRLNELSSPIMIRKMNQNNLSPIGSPYENVHKNNLKPKSPNTQSPRTRIKTTFAHKNLPSPQYFVFPTPPPKDNKEMPNFEVRNQKCDGIEKQLSLDEDIPMIDDVTVTNDIELRYSKIENDEVKDDKIEKGISKLEENVKRDVDNEIHVAQVDKLLSEKRPKNQCFDDVKKELMADIPELEEFEKDLIENKRDKIIKNITDDIRKMDIEAESIDSVLDENNEELKNKFDTLKEERKKLISQIHEIKCKMSEIRSQEDDILRELEMEKALIKGEYDSEIAILNIEQKKKSELMERGKKIEEDIRQLKEKQESRQNEMRDRVEIATLKAERIERDLKDKSATIEELQHAQDILDHETKMFEDLEFQHLEEESELLANREDLQNEIIALTKKIEAQKSRILTLKSEANSNLTSALDETKILQAEYVRLLNNVEVLTGKLNAIEVELKPIVAKLNDIERRQSPDSAFFTDQTRTKSGEFGYSPQSSDDDIDLKINNFDDHRKSVNDKFNSIDQMSQSMIVDIERRIISDESEVESPTKTSFFKEKKGFWERNFDSLKRKKKPKSPEKTDIMSQSLNENMFYNDNIENDSFYRFNSLRNSKNKKKDNGVVKSNSSSKIPTFAALGKIIKKDSFGKKTKDKDDGTDNKNRYVKNAKQVENNKYKSKSLSPDKVLSTDDVIAEENEIDDTKEPTEDETPRVFYRKSCGDEPSRNSMDFPRIGDSGKIPSQDDIDRISKVTIDAPILPNDIDTLGKKTLNSLMEIERKRMVLLEEQGCQMIENEREKISELKRRVQVETKKQWELKQRERSLDGDQLTSAGLCHNDSCQSDSCVDETVNVSSVFDDSSRLMSSSIEELRNSRTDTEDDKRSDDSRPLSNASDFSRDNILSLSNAPRRSRRGVAPYSESQRPLTRYLPVDRDDFDLRRHVETAGHQIELCPHVSIGPSSCRGYLHKLGAKFHTWSKRWFVFDRESKTFVYYWDKTEKKPRGGAYFQVIQEVYLDHGNTSKSPNPQTTFIVKTRQRKYYLMAPSGAAARIWIDVIFTGAQGYTEYLE